MVPSNEAMFSVFTKRVLMNKSPGVHDFGSGNFLKACLLTLSEIVEFIEVHFSVDGKLIYCHLVTLTLTSHI